VNAYIRESKLASLYRIISGFTDMPLSTCLYLGVKRHRTVYTYIRVSRNNSMYMSTPGFPKSCYLYTYVWVENVYISGFLKHSMINMTISGFPKMILSIFVYLCHERWPSMYAYIRVPKSAATYKPLLVFPIVALNMPIFKSKNAHVCVCQIQDF
jgi:hypothetical protein